MRSGVKVEELRVARNASRIASFVIGLVLAAAPVRATDGDSSDPACVAECESHGEAVYHACREEGAAKGIAPRWRRRRSLRVRPSAASRASPPVPVNASSSPNRSHADHVFYLTCCVLRVQR